MKKINYFFAAAMICMSVAACVKEAGNDNPGVNSGNTTEETIPDNYIELTFQVPGTDVKTSVDGNTVSWTAGDKIRICWDGGSSVSSAVVLEEGNASFTAMVAPEATDFYAVYPSTIEATVAEGNFNVTIPSSQSGRFADADIIVAKTTKEELSYAFRHAVSLVKFVISEENEKGISRAQFVDLANNSQLVGTMAITFDADNKIESSTVTEDTSLDVIDVTAVESGDNYMAVLPGKELTGFGLRLGSDSKWYPGLVGENPIPLGERLSLSTVDTKIHEGDYYIKPEGEGKGTSWDDAGNVKTLQSLLGDYFSGDAKNLARAWRLNGKTIKVAEGNYTSPDGVNGITARYIGEDLITFTIEGGYTTSGIKSSEARTIFGPAEGIDNYRAFFFCGPVSATLKDIEISNHERTGSAGGGAIYTAKKASLNIESCSIKNNSTTNNRAGGAILAEGLLTINRCEFIDNVAATAGGAIYIDQQGTCFVNNSTFESNQASTTNGGAIGVNGEIHLTGCEFMRNDAAKGDGGAIGLTGSLKANNCKFLENSSNAKNKSAVIGFVGGSSAYFNACEFRGNQVNNVNNGGTIIYTSRTDSKLGFNNCLFTENNAQASSFLIYTASTCIVSNTTIIDDSKTATNASLLYFGGDKPNTVVNNIVINNQTYYGPRGKLATSCFNIYSKVYSGYASTEYDICNIYVLNNGERITPTSGMSYYSWSGNIADFTKTDKATVATTIKSNTEFGEDFYSWLDELVEGPGTALDTDIRGVARTTGYWPGSYQE